MVSRMEQNHIRGNGLSPVDSFAGDKQDITTPLDVFGCPPFIRVFTREGGMLDYSKIFPTFACLLNRKIARK